MMVIVMYDISEDAPRNNLIKRLRYYGLRRIQKSVFCGLLEIEERFELASEFDFYLSSDKDSIALFPICESCVDFILIEGAMSLPQKEEYVFV